mmetsp:Transcript_9966/g.20194  ORF Transcript_9966/g.20194 Transcript_9966/m.20194 type:complete len:209 (+) Transcript_9966:194-820(+)
MRLFVSSFLLRFLPMKTNLLTLSSPSAQGLLAGPKLICSWTPWKTNFVAPCPWKDRRPLVRYRSAALSRRRSIMNMLNHCAWRLPLNSIPTDCTRLVLCVALSAESSKNEGSTSIIDSMLKESTLRIFSRGARERSVSIISANLLMLLSLALTSSFSSADTRSVLFSSILSENATCCSASLTFPSGFTSSRCWTMCLASARQMMESML